MALTWLGFRDDSSRYRFLFLLTQMLRLPIATTHTLCIPWRNPRGPAPREIPIVDRDWKTAANVWGTLTLHRERSRLSIATVQGTIARNINVDLHRERSRLSIATRPVGLV